MKNILCLLVGVLVGVIGSISFNRYNSREKKYFELQSDYKIEDRGTLLKGTKIQYDQSYSEGFTRYILYLNLKDLDVKESTTEHPNEIIPYWLDKE